MSRCPRCWRRLVRSVTTPTGAESRSRRRSSSRSPCCAATSAATAPSRSHRRGSSRPSSALTRCSRSPRAGAAAGCHEALFTLGERPELRYPIAAEWLDGERTRVDDRLPRRDGEARHRPDRIAAPCECGRAVPRGACRASSGRPGPGDDARVTARRPRLPPRLSGQDARAAPRDARGRGRSSRSPSRPASSSASARPDPTASSRSRRSRRRIAGTATCKR